MPAVDRFVTVASDPAARRDPGETMSGPIGLHGGGEYVSGDEPFLDALLAAAAAAHERRANPADFDVSGHALAPAPAPLRIVLLPTAAGRGMPDRAAATGRAAFERRAAATRRRVTVEVARVVDAASAADPGEAGRIARADLIHLPGGDPDLVPATLAGSAALAALEAAWQRGAVIAGASAGAMALAEWTWTSTGGIRGLGLVRGLAVVPHYDDVRRTAWQDTLDRLAPGGIGYLGLDERTGVISIPNGPDSHDWQVAGPGAAYWFARGAAEPVIGRHGDLLRLPA
ncbi:MAG: Type 1 glutamine amidotransferase-like domain-containing protein [Candidatus Limnocylindrales bacterium]